MQPRNGGVPCRLRSLNLVLTGRCNLACAYCYMGTWPGRSSTMPAKRVLDAIDFLLDSSATTQTLLFTGGEPLVALPLLRRAILHARRTQSRGKRLRIRINTNGTLLTPDIVSFLADQEVEVQLSFDGVAEAQGRRQESSFDRLDRLLIETRRSQSRFFRRHLAIAMIVGPQTAPWLASSIRYFLSRHVREIRLGAVFARRRQTCPPELVDLLDGQFRDVVEAALRYWADTGETPLALFRPARDPNGPQAGPARDLLCQAGGGECIAIDPTGEASVCPLILSGDFSRSAPLLALRDALLLGRFEDRAFISRLDSIRASTAGSGLFARRGKRSAFGHCSACEAASSCGACPASILLEGDNDDPDRVPDFQCALFRAAARHRARYLAGRRPRFSEGFGEALEAVRRM